MAAFPVSARGGVSGQTGKLPGKLQSLAQGPCCLPGGGGDDPCEEEPSRKSSWGRLGLTSAPLDCQLPGLRTCLTACFCSVWTVWTCGGAGARRVSLGSPNRGHAHAGTSVAQTPPLQP